MSFNVKKGLVKARVLKSRVAKISLVGLVGTSVANAAVTLPEIDTAQIETWAGVLLGAISLIWIVRKVIHLS